MSKSRNVGIGEFATQTDDTSRNVGIGQVELVGGGAGGGIEEAPKDSKQYARKNGAWEEVRGGGGASTWDEIEGKPSTFPPSSHTHTASDITDLSVPTKTSDLTNDSDFTTKAYVDGLVGDVESLLAAL